MTAPKQFLRLPAVIALVGKSRTAIYRDIQAGNFPAPIRIGARSVAWDSTAIESWQQGRINASTGGAPASISGAQG
jgi:prophage regulatory protein